MSGHEYIKAERLKHGLSLRAVSELSGVSYVHVKNIEDGRQRPSLDITLKLLHALGIKMKDFLGAIGYKDPRRGKLVAVQGFEPRALHSKNRRVHTAAV